VQHVLFESLDAVLWPLDQQDGPHRQDPASIKKMLNGDATWAIHKVVLRWMIDTIDMTIQLPVHRIIRLFEILDLIAPTQCRTTVSKWQNLLGELRSTVLAIPGEKGLFSVLQSMLKNKCDQ
jgi:hypothetical protein